MDNHGVDELEPSIGTSFLPDQQQGGEQGHDIEDAVAATASSGSDENLLEIVGRNRLSLLEKIQLVANCMAHIFALLNVLIVSWWIHLMGGLSWKKGEAKLVFNWHPLLMIVAFCFMTVASLSFRFPLRSAARTRTKLVHGMAWLVAALSATIALIAVFKSHNDSESGFIANLYSFHSWMGLIVMILYVLQFMVGAYSFWWSRSAILKAVVLQFHILVGPLVYVSFAYTIMLGIQEKEGFVGCSYKVTAPDTHFIPQWSKIPLACQVSHVLGLVVFLTMVCTFVALHTSRSMPTLVQGGSRMD